MYFNIYGKIKLKFYIRLHFELWDSTRLFAFKHLSLQDLLDTLDIKENPYNLNSRSNKPY